MRCSFVLSAATLISCTTALALQNNYGYATFYSDLNCTNSIGSIDLLPASGNPSLGAPGNTSLPAPFPGARSLLIDVIGGAEFRDSEFSFGWSQQSWIGSNRACYTGGDASVKMNEDCDYLPDASAFCPTHPATDGIVTGLFVPIPKTIKALPFSYTQTCYSNQYNLADMSTGSWAWQYSSMCDGQFPLVFNLKDVVPNTSEVQSP